MANTSLTALITGTRSEIKLDRLGKIWSDSDITLAIASAIEEIESKGNYKYPENQADADFNTVDGTQEYDMEVNIPNYQGIELVQYDDKVLSPTTLEELKRNYKDFQKGTPTHYYTYGGKIGLHPYPNDAKVVDVTYKKYLTSPAEASDLSPLPRTFDLAIKLYAAYICLSQPGDPKNTSRAQTKLIRFKAQIAKLFNAHLLPDRENILYKSSYIPNSAFRTRFGRITNPNNL